MTPVGRRTWSASRCSPRPRRRTTSTSPASRRCASGWPGPPADPVRGAGPLRQRLQRAVAGRVLLVGDAAGYVDALTGEGIALALAQAPAAVRAVIGGDLAALRARVAAARAIRALPLQHFVQFLLPSMVLQHAGLLRIGLGGEDDVGVLADRLRSSPTRGRSPSGPPPSAASQASRSGWLRERVGVQQVERSAGPALSRIVRPRRPCEARPRAARGRWPRPGAIEQAGAVAAVQLQPGGHVEQARRATPGVEAAARLATITTSSPPSPRRLIRERRGPPRRSAPAAARRRPRSPSSPVSAASSATQQRLERRRARGAATVAALGSSALGRAEAIGQVHAVAAHALADAQVPGSSHVVDGVACRARRTVWRELEVGHRGLQAGREQLGRAAPR